jgi:hypothetical protein
MVIDEKLKWTVLILRPDYQWDGAQADWVHRDHVVAAGWSAACEMAVNELARVEELPYEDLAVLACYQGHLQDHFDPFV